MIVGGGAGDDRVSEVWWNKEATLVPSTRLPFLVGFICQISPSWSVNVLPSGAEIE